MHYKLLSTYSPLSTALGRHGWQVRHPDSPNAFLYCTVFVCKDCAARSWLRGPAARLLLLLGEGLALDVAVARAPPHGAVLDLLRVWVRVRVGFGYGSELGLGLGFGLGAGLGLG